ncbi:hypothetical protein PAMA_004590 [Pampus argenteus]
MVTFHTGSSEDLLKPFKDVILALEGDNVTLSCNYSGTPDRLYWYQQKSSSSPKLLIMEYSEKRWLHGRELFDSSCEHQTKHNSQNHSTLIQSEHSVTAFHFCQHGNTRCNFTVFSSCSLMNNVRLMASFTLLFPGQIAGDEISPEEEKVSGREGESVTLRCEYQTSSNNIYLYWYRHHSDLQAPQFILWKGARSRSDRENIPDNRYGSKTTRTTTELTIKRLTLADSALYYCALDTQ